MECPFSFTVSLHEDSKLPVGAHVDLEKVGEDLWLLYGSERISRMSVKAAKRIMPCLDSGYRYDGVIKQSNAKKHAEFTKST